MGGMECDKIRISKASGKPLRRRGRLHHKDGFRVDLLVYKTERVDDKNGGGHAQRQFGSVDEAGQGVASKL